MEGKARNVSASRKRKGDDGNNELVLLNKMTEIISTAVAPIMERLGELESRSNSYSGGTPEVVTTINQQPVENRVIMMQTPVKPTFSGKGLHPMDFIEDLQKYLTKMNYQDAALDTALDCLSGEAKNWSKIYSEKWQNFEEFKFDFLNQYWGREAQNQVKRRLGSQRWTSQNGKKMTEYFTELFSEAKRLTSYSNDDAIVEDIMQHYPQEIRRLWVTKEFRGAIEAVRFLKNIESVSGNEERHSQNEQRQYKQQDRSRYVRAAAIESTRREYQRNWKPATQLNEDVIQIEEEPTTSKGNEGN